MTNIFDERFWVAFAVVSFVGLVYKTTQSAVNSILNKRVEQVKLELEQATALKQKAVEYLEHYKKQQTKIEMDIQQMVSNAETQMHHITENAKKNLMNDLQKKTDASAQRMANYETAVLQEIKNQAIDIAVQTVQALVKNRLNNDISEDLIKNIMNDVNKLAN